MEEEIKTLKAKVAKHEQRRIKQLQRSMLKCRDGNQVQVTLGVQPYSSKDKDPISETYKNEDKNSIEEDQSLNLQSKQ